MKKKILLVALIVALVVPFGVRSEDLQLTAGQPLSVSLTSPSVTYILSSTTGIESLSVDGSSLTLTLTSGDSVKVRQSNGYRITNDLGLSTECDGPSTFITFTATAVITSGTTAKSCGGGGGGGSQPTSIGISINNGATETTDRSVTLSLTANDAAEMVISNQLTFADSAWETFAETKSWTLTEGLGEKRVYVNYKAINGGTSGALSAVINLVATLSEPGSTDTPDSIPPVVAKPPLPSGSDLQDGWLVKEVDQPAVYLVEGGLLRPILNESTFLAHDFAWSAIRLITSVSDYTNGALLVSPIKDGSLIKISGDAKVYVIESGMKRWIMNEQVFSSLGYLWGNIMEVTSDVFAEYPEGVSISKTTEGTSSIGEFSSYLVFGSFSDEVRLLQTTLKGLGFFPEELVATGYFGQVTRQSVIEFQNSRGIEPFGVVGPKTRAALNGL